MGTKQRSIPNERLQGLGKTWIFSTARYCQAIREGNKLRRLEWVSQRLSESKTFDNMIFTHESLIQLEVIEEKVFGKRGQPRKMKCKYKHLLKVHIWEEISKRGATHIVIFSRIMTAMRYADILSASLFPFIRKYFRGGHHFYQENDPTHTSWFVQGFFEENNVNWWRSPAESRDLNPIEKVRGAMKTFLWYKVKPKNFVELKRGIKAYWKSLTPETCSRYVNHLQKVLPDVIREKGGPSGHYLIDSIFFYLHSIILSCLSYLSWPIYHDYVRMCE